MRSCLKNRLEISEGACEGIERDNIITATCLDDEKSFSKVLQQLIFQETRAKVILGISNLLKVKKQRVKKLVGF